MAEVTYDIYLNSEPVVTSAEQAATALESLDSSIMKDQESLKSLDASMRLLRGGTGAAATKFAELKKQRMDLKSSLANNEVQRLEIESQFPRQEPRKTDPEPAAPKKGDPAISTMRDLVKMIAKAKSPGSALKDIALDAKLGSLDELKASIKSTAITALGLAVAFKTVSLAGKAAHGVVSKTSAAASGAASMVLSGTTLAAQAAIGALTTTAKQLGNVATLAVTSASTLRTQNLEIAAMSVRLSNFWRRPATSASDLTMIINQVTADTSIARGELIGMSEELYSMGLRGRNLQKALETMAIVAETKGAGAASQFAQMAAGMSYFEGGLNGLSDRLKRELGPIAELRRLDLGTQVAKAKRNLSSLFSGVDITPLLKEAKDFFYVFDPNNPTGQAIKSSITSILSPFMGLLPGAGNSAREFFEGLVIGTQRTAIDVMSAIRSIRLDPLTQQIVAVTTEVGKLTSVTSVGITSVRAVSMYYLGPFILLAKTIEAINHIRFNGLKQSADDAFNGIISGAENAANKISKLLSILSSQSIFGAEIREPKDAIERTATNRQVNQLPSPAASGSQVIKNQKTVSNVFTLPSIAISVASGNPAAIGAEVRRILGDVFEGAAARTGG